ncbi:MAG: hypothetical protein CSA39_05295 [Flavobacteriales bacterium]|nr:MAG: hypothetical protein CSA39_05295 [Flavobacteriales bacterium]
MKYLHILLLISLFACTSNTKFKKPDNLIDKDQMVAIWTDIYLANGAKSVRTKDSVNYLDYLPLVFEKYNIDSTRFSESNTYYTSTIEEYLNMFKEVEANIKAIKEKYDPTSELDSIINEAKERQEED